MALHASMSGYILHTTHVNKLAENAVGTLKLLYSSAAMISLPLQLLCTWNHQPLHTLCEVEYELTGRKGSHLSLFLKFLVNVERQYSIIYHIPMLQESKNVNKTWRFFSLLILIMVLNITLLLYIVLKVKGMEGRERELVNTNMK